jgi:serine/threonine-protein kinase
VAGFVTTTSAEVPPAVAGLVLPGGRWRLDRLVNRGERSEVWRGTDLAGGRPVAIKTPRAGADAETTRSIRAEAQFGAAVRHPAVVETLDFVEAEGRAHLVRGFVSGTPLEAQLRQIGALPPSVVLTALAQVARGLRAVHDAGLVHRDVSAPNTVWDGQRATLLDLGIATPIGGPTLTADARLPGNPEYLAPEIAQGKTASIAADIYALGVLALYALTGAKPFARATPEATAIAHVMDPSPTPPVGLDTEAQSVLAQMLAKDPAKRPADALAVARAFEAFAH